METREKVATATFAIFLIWAFYHASIISWTSEDVWNTMRIWRPNDPKILSTGIPFILNNNDIDGTVLHAYPLLGVLIFYAIPLKLLNFLAHFAIVSIYLLLYTLVSKKIIYWYPLTIPIPMYFSVFTPSTIDWLIFPLIYHLLTKRKNIEATTLGIILVYIHGFIPLFYLTALYLFLKKYRLILYTVAFTLPQLIPLLYFSGGYFTVWNETLGVYAWKMGDRLFYSFLIPVLWFRILTVLTYVIVFFMLVRNKTTNHRGDSIVTKQC